MATHAIWFDFYYYQQLSTMKVLPDKAFADIGPRWLQAIWIWLNRQGRKILPIFAQR